MTINLQIPDITELKPKITVFGVGGAGGNAVNNMIQTGLDGCEFVVANTDAQALSTSKSDRIIQMGIAVTEGLGAGSQPEIGRAAAEEVIDEILDHLSGSHMVFITAGMGGGTGTGSAPVIARAARDLGILTVGVVTKPFQFEGLRRMRVAEAGIELLQESVDTLIVIPNQNLFRIANEQTTFADAFSMADEVLYSGVACVTDLMVKEGLINLDFADVRSVMRGMGKAMMGTGEATGDGRASQAAEAAIANPLLDETSMLGAKGLLISITGGNDLTLFEVDEAATRIREEVDTDANIILGATFDETLEGVIRVSVVATGIEMEAGAAQEDTERRLADLATKLRTPSLDTARPATMMAIPAMAPQIAPPSASAAVNPVDNLVSEIEAELTLSTRDIDRQANQPIVVDADPDVTIHPLRVSPAAPIQVDPESDILVPGEAQTDAGDAAQPYIPPLPEIGTLESQVPSIEDFPPIAQRQMAEKQLDSEDDRRPMSLLRRLAGGLSKRDDDVPQVASDEVTMPAPMPADAPHAVAPAHPVVAPPQAAMPIPPATAPAPQPTPPVSEFAKRPSPRPLQSGAVVRGASQGDLDIHGRQQPRQAPRPEDDQLEIPAFLRRQAN
jgi:cell division protein FtsZ